MERQLLMHHVLPVRLFSSTASFAFCWYQPVEIIFKRGHSKPHFAHMYFKIHHAENETDCFILHGIAIKLVYYCL